jgi:hypothetical protein
MHACAIACGHTLMGSLSSARTSSITSDEMRIERVKVVVQEIRNKWEFIRRPSCPAGPGRPRRDQADRRKLRKSGDWAGSDASSNRSDDLQRTVKESSGDSAGGTRKLKRHRSHDREKAASCTGMAKLLRACHSVQSHERLLWQGAQGERSAFQRVLSGSNACLGGSSPEYTDRAVKRLCAPLVMDASCDALARGSCGGGHFLKSSMQLDKSTMHAVICSINTLQSLQHLSHPLIGIQSESGASNMPLSQGQAITSSVSQLLVPQPLLRCTQVSLEPRLLSWSPEASAMQSQAEQTFGSLLLNDKLPFLAASLAHSSRAAKNRESHWLCRLANASI